MDEGMRGCVVSAVVWLSGLCIDVSVIYQVCWVNDDFSLFYIRCSA